MGFFSEMCDLIFPRQCAGCGKFDVSLCEACCRAMRGSWERVEERTPYLQRVDGSGVQRAAFPVWVCGEYGRERRLAIVTWKNHADGDLDAAIGCAFEEALASGLGEKIEIFEPLAGVPGPIVVVPAPSRWKRSHDGRFVAGVLADSCVRALLACSIPAVRRDLLVASSRRGSSVAGRGWKSRGIRARDCAVREKVILVDDVVTTGATLNGCARALEKIGAQVLGAVALAAAEDPRKK